VVFSCNRAILVPNSKEPLEHSGERGGLGTSVDIGHEPLHRFLFAMELCRERDVLHAAAE